MAEVYHDGVYLWVEVNYLEYDEVLGFLLRFNGEDFEKVFYCLRNRPLSRGLRFIEDEVDYAHFIDTAYENPDLPISIYLDHSGDGLDEWGESSSEENETVIQGEKEPVDLGERAHPAPRQRATAVGGERVADDIVEDHMTVKLNKTVDDEFLNKLCHDNNNDEKEENDDILVQPSFNPDIPFGSSKSQSLV
ncbi:hypothetical protein LXL04_003448 [Taraxacum kok-saghyz]